jgi:hypothetical protein
MRRHKVLSDNNIHVLNLLVYYVSLPAIIFISFYNLDWTSVTNLKILGFNLVLLAVISMLTLILLSFTNLKPIYKAAIFSASIVGNTVYIGFPLAQKAFDANLYNNFLIAATPQLVFGIVISVLVYEFYVLKSKNFKTYFFDFAKNPLIISLFLGIIFSLMQIKGELVKTLFSPIQMFAATASPIALLALGGFLRGKYDHSDFINSMFVSVVKLVLFPLVLFLLAKQFLSYPSEPSILSAAMPTAATVFVIAEKYNVVPKFIASTLFLTTIISIFSVSIILVLIK